MLEKARVCARAKAGLKPRGIQLAKAPASSAPPRVETAASEDPTPVKKPRRSTRNKAPSPVPINISSDIETQDMDGLDYWCDLEREVGLHGKPLVQAGSQFLPINLCGMDGEVDELLNA